LFGAGDVLLVNEIVVCELAAGIRPRHEEAIEALLEPLEFVQPGLEAALAAGRWRNEARAAGSTLSLGDALIAAAAETSNAAVLTRNVRDFSLTPARVETY
jgi:predicted nucleic acid-binding protein